MVMSGSTGSLWIGNRPGYSAMSGVSFDDFQLFTTALAASQVQSLYAAGVAGAGNLPTTSPVRIASGARPSTWAASTSSSPRWPMAPAAAARSPTVPAAS